MRFDPAKIRLYVSAPLGSEASVSLEKDQAHYLGTVMRRNVGDAVHLFNGQDGEWRAVIDEIDRKSATLKVESQTRQQTDGPDLWLVFAPIKRGRIDYLAQKATELGVSLLQPVFTERTAVSRVKLERLEANAIEAAEQCECLTVPDVGEEAALSKLLENWPGDRRLIFCDEQGGPPALEAFAAVKAVAANDAVHKWAVLIGPEGGFSEKERELIRRVPGNIPISLGPRILRTDTAAVASLSLFQAVLGDW